MQGLRDGVRHVDGLRDSSAVSGAATPTAVGAAMVGAAKADNVQDRPATKRKRVDEGGTATDAPPSATSSAFLPGPAPVSPTSRLPPPSQSTPSASPAASPRQSPTTDRVLVKMRHAGESWDAITAQMGQSLGYCQARYLSLVDGTATPHATPAPLPLPVAQTAPMPGPSTPAPPAAQTSKAGTWAPWTTEETRVLLEAKERGQTYAQAALLLPGRTPGACQQQSYKMRKLSNGASQATPAAGSPAPHAPAASPTAFGAGASAPSHLGAPRWSAAEDATIYARYHDDNWSFADIAGETGRSESAVAKRYYNVKKKLQAGLRPYHADLTDPEYLVQSADSPSGSPTTPGPRHVAGPSGRSPSAAAAPVPAAGLSPALAARARMRERRWSGYAKAVEALRRLREGGRGGDGGGAREREGELSVAVEGLGTGACVEEWGERTRRAKTDREEEEVDQLDGDT